MMGALFAAAAVGVDPTALEDVHITIRGRYLGLCSVLLDDTLVVGPCFRDGDGGVYMLTAGAESSSVDSFVELVRLDRQPEVFDLPPLLRFGKQQEKMTMVPVAYLDAIAENIEFIKGEIADISEMLSDLKSV